MIHQGPKLAGIRGGGEGEGGGEGRGEISFRLYHRSPHMPGKSAERSAGTHGGDVPLGGSPRGRHLESQPEEADVDRFSDGGRVHDGVGHVQAPPVRRPSDRSQALPSTRSIWDIFGLGGGGGSGRGKGSDVDRKKGEAGRSWWVSHSNFGTPREGEECIPSRRGSTTANESHGSEEGFSWPVESEGEGGEGEGEDSWDGSAAGIGSSPPTPSGGHTSDTSLITFSARKGRVDRAAGCAFGTKGTPQSLSEYTLHNHDEAQTLPTREEAGAGVGVEAGAGYDYRDELGSFEDIAVLLDDEGGERMPQEDQPASMASDWRRKDIARVESDFKSLQPVIFTAAAARGAGATAGPGTSAGDDDDDGDGDGDGDEAWEGKNEADDANDEVFKSQGHVKRSVSFAHALNLARAGSDGSMGYPPPLLGGMSLSSMMPHQGYLVKGKRSMSIMKNIIDGMTTSFVLKERETLGGVMVKSWISHTVSIIASAEKDESLLVGSSQKSILHARPIKTNEIEDLLEYDFHYAKLMIRWKEGGWRNKQMEVEFESPTDLSDFVQVIVKLHASVKIHSLG